MRMIDADALKKGYALLMWKEHNPYDAVKVCDVINQTLDFIDNAPTVHAEDCKGCPYCPDSNSGIPIGVE